MTQKYHNFHHLHTPPIKGVHANETTKIVQIKDAKDNLRYKVILTSDTEENPYSYLNLYKVIVVAYIYGSIHGVKILEIPGPDEKPCSDYGWIQKQFDKCVQNYSMLVRAETRDFQDISVYKEKIGYEKIHPKCCATCRFCKRVHTPGDFICGKTDKLECHNPKNQERFTYDVDVKPIRHHHHHSWDRLPWQSPHEEIYEHERKFINKVCPQVEPLGCCDNYELDYHPYVPVHGDSICEIIDRKVDECCKNQHDQLSCDLTSSISCQIDNQISCSLSTVIIPAVDVEIEAQLSATVVDGNKLLEDYNNDGVIDENDFLLINGN